MEPSTDLRRIELFQVGGVQRPIFSGQITTGSLGHNNPF